MERSMVVSIIGRPNVGKSTVYNRLIKRDSKNITHDLPGVTRDRHYGFAKFDLINNESPREVILIDTGGFYLEKINEPSKTEKEKRNFKFFNIMIDHAKLAIDESDMVLFVVDVREGPIPIDKSIIDYLRMKKKKFWLVINKYDSDKQMGDEADFYTLGVDIDDIFMISAAHKRGTDELAMRIQKEVIELEKRVLNNESNMPRLQIGVTPREKVVSKVALVGGPNAGKSTLLNCLIGAPRALVSDIPGTTVDPIEGFFDLYFDKEANLLDQKMSWGEKTDQLISDYQDYQKNNSQYVQNHAGDKDISHEIYEKVFVEETQENVKELPEEISEGKKVEGNYWRTIHLIDTAGIRRQKSIDDFVEEQSVYRSLSAITHADVVVYLIDAVKGINHQDQRLVDIALEKGKSVILAINKIDLVSEKLKTPKDKKLWIEELRDNIPWLEFCDIVPLSAKYKQHIGKFKKVLVETILIRNTRIPTSAVNQTISELVDKNSIVITNTGGKRLKVKYSSMIKANPPTFLLFTNRSKGIPENYKRYLKNGIRDSFDLKNAPIHLIFRTSSDLEKRAHPSKKDSPTKR